MTIILDASRMQTRSTAHPYLKEMLSFPDYYGANLDALYDCLTELGETEVFFINEDRAGDFYKKIRRVFRDAARDNADLHILETLPPVPEEDSSAPGEEE